MNKKILVLFFVLVLVVVSIVFVVIFKDIKIGIDLIYVFFELKNVSGELVGFDIDIVKELCNCIDIKCIFVESDFDVFILLLKVKKIDVIIFLFLIIEKC